MATATRDRAQLTAFDHQEVARAIFYSLPDPLGHFRRNHRDYAESHLQIRTKDRRIVPFAFNAAQEDYYQHRTLRDLILKPRQLGFTTEIAGLLFADTVLTENTLTVQMAQDLETTKQVFEIVRLFWKTLPAEEVERIGEPQYSNRRELYWPRINSRYFVGTAGADTLGRGITINNLHLSEAAFYAHPDETLGGLLEAVPLDGRIIFESTANGVGNHFYDRWQRAKGLQAGDGTPGYEPHFYVWWEEPGYALPGPPLREVTEEEARLKRRWKLSDDQIRWRRWKIADKGLDLFRQEYPEDDESCFIASGRGVFDQEALRKQAARIAGEPPAQTLSVLGKVGSHPIAVDPATLRLYRLPLPGAAYVIGADIGEGVRGGDPSCGCVLDYRTGEQVAELHGNVPPDRFGHLLARLGWLFNTAMLAVEANNHGHSTLNTLRNVCRYPNLYYHVRYNAASGKQEAKLGWPTDSQTKPILVDDLAHTISEGTFYIHSDGLISELRTFVTKDDGKQEAEEGKHDDRVIAAGIAVQARKRRMRDRRKEQT